MKLLGFGGRVCSLPIHLSGTCSQPQRRQLVGGPEALPEDFSKPVQVIRIDAVKPLSEASWTRPKSWTQTANLETDTLSVLQQLRKRKTFRAQQTINPKLDAIDQMDTGFEINAAEQQQRAEHRKIYTSYLESQRKQRAAVKEAKHKQIDVFDFCFGSAAAQSDAEREPLWLHQPYGNDTGAAGGEGRKLAVFDQTKLIARKFKLKPQSPEEARDCKRPLSPKELMLITGGPKTLDFGTISVFTTVARNFTVMNDLRTSALVAVNAAEAPELSQSGPASQVVPPGSCCGFDIILHCKEPRSVRKPISYVINGLHTFKFTAVAEVVPLELEVPAEELVFEFDSGCLDMDVSRVLTLTNPGTYAASFCWEHPRDFKGTPAFSATPREGTVEPKQSMQVRVVFTPVFGCQLDHVLTAVVKGGSARTVACKALVSEARVVPAEKRLCFGTVSVGLRAEKPLTLRNLGQTEAVIYFDEPPAGWTVQPMSAAIAAGSSFEVSVEVVPEEAHSGELALAMNVRYGKPIKVALQIEAMVPEVSVQQDELDFSAVVVDGTTWRPLTLINESPVAAILVSDLTERRELELQLSSKQAEAEAKAAKADTDAAETATVAQTVIDDDGSEVSPLQLISTPSSTLPLNGEGPEETEESNGDVLGDETRVYRITVPAATEDGPGQLALSLGFAPKEAGAVELELPLALVGVEAFASLRRVVVGEGLRPRLQVSNTRVRLGERIIRDTKLPYVEELTLTNSDGEPLAFQFGADSLSDSPFSMRPLSGTLAVGGSATVTVSFAPTMPGQVLLQVPIFISEGAVGDFAGAVRTDRPYLSVALAGTATTPRLVFDRPEVVLPPVPLGVTSRAAFYVINEGYDNLQIDYRLPADSVRMPVQLHFPEGNLVGISRKRVMLMVSFVSKKPTSFTAKLELLDGEGHRFPVNVTATADNSILTLQPYLSCRREHIAIGVEEGRPHTLVDEAEMEQQRAMNARSPTVTTQKGRAAGPLGQLPPEEALPLAKAALTPPTPSDDALAAAAAETARSAHFVIAYISAALLGENGSPSGFFPASLLHPRAKPIVDLVTLLSGKSMQLPPQPADRKNMKALTSHLHGVLEALVVFVRSQGGLLGGVRTGHLLPLEDFLRLAEEKTKAAAADGTVSVIAQRKGLPRRLRQKLELEHRAHHERAWLELILQIIKTLVLNRITARSLKGLPGFPDAEANEAAADSTLGGSNVYSAPEQLLIRWLEYHWAAVEPRAAADQRLLELDHGLRDGHVFAAVVLSHCPFLRSGSKGSAVGKDSAPDVQPAPEDDVVTSRSEAGSALHLLHPQPCDAAASVGNLKLVLAALNTLGMAFGGITAETLCEAPAREQLLFALFLYQSLPHYVPKTTVQLIGGLHEPISKSIELTNPSRKPISYAVRLEGASCFRIEATTVRLEPQQTITFRVGAMARFTGVAHGRITFLSRSESGGAANASTLVFLLHATISIGAPLERATCEARLYSPTPAVIDVTNPFDEPCSARISLLETKPALVSHSTADQQPAQRAGRRPKGTKGGQEPPLPRRDVDAAAAVASMLGGDSAEDLEKKLPPSVWCGTPTVALGPKATVSLTLQFLPFQLGEYGCTILFADEQVGEFSYELRATSTLPQPLEKIAFAAEVSTSQTREIVLPYRNPQLERARQAVLDRSPRDREKFAAIWGKDPLMSGPITMSIVCSSYHFTVPASIDLSDGRYRGSKTSAGSVPSTAHGSRGHSVIATPREGRSTAGDGAASNANKLDVRFVPKDPGLYSGEVMLSSPLDVRIYEVAATGKAPDTEAYLEFKAPARQCVRQELPVVNGMDVDWAVQAVLLGDCFSGPSSIRVPPRATAYYPLEFKAEWKCEREGELILLNAVTSDKYVYKLKALAEEPLAEEHLVLDCAARVPQKLAFELCNISASGEKCTYSVDSDLLHVSGPPTVEVPSVPASCLLSANPPRASRPDAARRHEADWLSQLTVVWFEYQVPERPRGAQSKREETTYELMVNPQLGGITHGSVTFTLPDGRFLWYTVELRSSPPPSEGKLHISAPLRKVVAVEIPLMNPSEEALNFEVTIQGDSLYGDPTLAVPPGPSSSSSYELFYSPLIAGVTHGSVSFVNALAGEFWYELEMTAEAPTPIELPLLKCGVGGAAMHNFTLSNPSGDELPLKLQISNPTNFSLAAAAPQTPLLLAPYAELEVVLTYTPTALDMEQGADISLSHPSLGEWLYTARGIGCEPGEMPTTEVTSALRQPASGTVIFRNPFESVLVVNVALEQSADSTHGSGQAGEPAFKLLRKSTSYTVARGSKLQLPFTFCTLDMSERAAILVLKADFDGRALQWRYPLSGVAVSRPLQRPIQLQCRARQPLQKGLALPIPGLAEGAVNEGFTYELDVAPEHAELLGRTLRLTPKERTLNGSVLHMTLDWQPLRPIRTSIALVVQKSSGGRWRYDLTLEARDPEPDDVIVIEAALNKIAAVSFRLCNVFNSESYFTAHFTPDSPSVFSVAPVSGVLAPAGSSGTVFTVSYSPLEYGKPVRGALVILTDEMQWNYEVRGSHPVYEVPRVPGGRVDHQLQSHVQRQLGNAQKKNFVRDRAHAL